MSNSLKLDESDYENIFLRVRSRLVKQILAGVAALLCICGVVTVAIAYQRINTVVAFSVDQYVDTDAFMKETIAAYHARMSDLERRLDVLNESLPAVERRAAELSQIPITITDDGVVLTNNVGVQLRIQTGMTASGAAEQFRVPYQRAPLVILILDLAERNNFDLAYARRLGAGSMALAASPTGFGVPNDSYRFRYRWIAMGQ